MILQKTNKLALMLSIFSIFTTNIFAAEIISASDIPTGFAGINWKTKAKNVQTVSTKTDLVNYAKKGGYIIYVDGIIDMSDGMLPTEGGASSAALDTFVANKSSYKNYESFKTAYAASCRTSTNDKSSTASESSLGSTLWTLNKAYGEIIKLNIASNTTIIGLTNQSGIKGGTIQINSASNIVIRNLSIQDAYDPFPHHEKNDGFNAQWDGIGIQGTSSNIWIDHCTIADTLHISTVSNSDSVKEKWQTYDGLCDMKGDVKNITISFCKFEEHDKTMLIGSSDSDGSNKTRTITISNNYFYNCGQRLPMVRNSQIHLLNNFYSAEKPYYSQQYAVGVRKEALIVAENNYFDSGIKYSFKDSDGTLFISENADNSSSGKKSTTSSSQPFSPSSAYSYTKVSAEDAKELALKSAGAGILSVEK